VKTYVYDYVSGLTTNWHNGGGLLIITDGDPQDAWKEFRQEHIDHEEYGADSLIIELPEPTLVYNCSGVEKQIFIFEDAGCC
jgi:hypothetical protein